MKKRILAMGLAAALLMPVCALGDYIFSGEVTASDTKVIVAPYGGSIANLSVRQGESIRVGDPIAEIETTKIYAPADGTVSAVFGAEGDSAEEIKNRYKAFMYIEPMNRYSMTDCTTEKAYNASETHYIHVGEKVYLSCVKDGTHRGQGTVVSIDDKNDSSYAVEITGGEFYMAESVNIFRSFDLDQKSRIGRGTIGRTAPFAVNGEGSVLRVHVKPGDKVERGELLFETVKGALDGLYAPGTTVYSDAQGVVASVDTSNGATVEKGTKLATIYPGDKMQVKMVVNETDLHEVRVGSKVDMEFTWDIDSGKRFEGTVSSISFLNEKQENSTSANYMAYIDFEPDETVRIGMTVTVYLKEE